MEILVVVTDHWVTIKKPLSIIEKGLKIAQEIGDRSGEGTAYGKTMKNDENCTRNR